MHRTSQVLSFWYQYPQYKFLPKPLELLELMHTPIFQVCCGTGSCFFAPGNVHTGAASPAAANFPAGSCTRRLLSPAGLADRRLHIRQCATCLQMQSPGLEADDIIATLAVRALAEGCHVTIASPDKVPSV